MKLRKHNIEILNSLRKEIVDYKLSNPLLVSSDEEYVEKIRNTKSIMYIGQETNGWELNQNIDKIEDCYLNFLSSGATNREFWKFLKLLRNKDNNDLRDIIWSNALICGKYEEKGTPIVTDLLQEKSLQNLIFLYQYFKPFMIVIVAGPHNPYYEVVTEFLKHINSSIQSLYPKSNEMLISDEKENIHYTYHPNYLNRRGKLLELSKTINSFYTK